MPASCPPSSHFDLIFSNMNHPVLVTGQDSNCTSIVGAAFSTCCLLLILVAFTFTAHEAGSDIETGADIGPGPIVNDGAFQAQSNNIQDSFDSLMDFGSNGYHYGLSGFLPFQSSLPVLGEPSSARTSARSVLYNKTEVLNKYNLQTPCCH